MICTISGLDPSPMASVSQRFSVERLLPHSRRIAARKGHPLLSARNLKELVNASWVRPSLTERSMENDFEEAFQQADLPQPNVVVHSTALLITTLLVANSDLLTILPQQIFSLMPIGQFCAPLEFIAPIPASPICMVYRQSLPLTPLAEQLSDLMRREAQNYLRKTSVSMTGISTMTAAPEDPLAPKQTTGRRSRKLSRS
jgi:LysR family transcriptional regulator of abg operon